jgi:LruC domain-containing protein
MLNIRLQPGLLMVFALTIVLTSCSKTDPEAGLTDVNQLNVSESFGWNTSRPVEFAITSPVSLVIRIESEDHTAQFHKGFYNGIDDFYKVTISLPNDVESVLVNGHNVPVTSANISFALDGGPLLKGGQSVINAISYWNFDENTGNVVNDRQGTNSGKIVGATWADGLQGSALRFDGEQSNVDIPNSESLQVVLGLTMMAWVKTENYTSAKILQKGDWDGFGVYLDLWKGWKAAIYLDDKTSHDVGTLDGRPLLNQWYHLAMTYDGQYLKLYVNGIEKGSNYAPGKLFKNTRNFSIGSDNAFQKFFKGTIDEVYLYGEVLMPEQIISYYQQVPNSDKDGDGIPDADDDFPEDKERAFSIYYPALFNGSLAFEDLWPGKGDYDFNDLVLDYRFNTVTSPLNLVKEIKLDITIRAIGASLTSGFGFQFGGEKLNSNDIRVTGYNIVSDLYKIGENGTEVNQNKPTIIVFDKASRLLKGQGGTGVNTDPAFPYSEPVTVSILIEVTSGQYTSDDIGVIDFNPFIVVKEDRGREIHLPDHSPTGLASSEYFGTQQDKSDPASKRYYKTAENLPWALNLNETFDYPIEKSQITSAHLKFYDWAASSGLKYSDWYKEKAGYRANSSIYKK